MIERQTLRECWLKDGWASWQDNLSNKFAMKRLEKLLIDNNKGYMIYKTRVNTL